MVKPGSPGKFVDKSHPLLCCSAESAASHGGWSLLCLLLYFLSFISAFCVSYSVPPRTLSLWGLMMERQLATYGHAMKIHQRLREGDKRNKKLSITGFAVNGWVFDATLGSCCSEQREGCVREQRQCQCVTACGCESMAVLVMHLLDL